MYMQVNVLLKEPIWGVLIERVHAHFQKSVIAYGFLYASLRKSEVYWLSGKLRKNVRFGIS